MSSIVERYATETTQGVCLAQECGYPDCDCGRPDCPAAARAAGGLAPTPPPPTPGAEGSDAHADAAPDPSFSANLLRRRWQRRGVIAQMFGVDRDNLADAFAVRLRVLEDDLKKAARAGEGEAQHLIGCELAATQRASELYLAHRAHLGAIAARADAQFLALLPTLLAAEYPGCAVAGLIDPADPAKLVG